MSAVGRALLPEPCWSCASQPFSLPSAAWARQPRSSHLPAGNFWEQLMDIQEALPCGLKVLQGIISGQVQWSPSCLSWLFRIKGERDSAPGSLFLQALIIPLHPSLQFRASGHLCAQRWLRGDALTSRAGAGRLWASGKPEMFPGALAFGKQRKSYLTAQWMRAELHFEYCQLCCLSAPCQMTLTPEPSFFSLSSSQLQER